jgi:cyclophilin family peptidyl-prolyl cis-trans isomerase
MNAARGLGSLKLDPKKDTITTTVINALLETASNDTSWMVRVNAVTSLGQFKFKIDDLKKVYFLIAFEGKKDPNEHVRLSAIRAMATSYSRDVKLKDELIHLILDQFITAATWREKTAVLGSLTAMFGKTVIDHKDWRKVYHSCIKDSNRYCRAQAVESLNPLNDEGIIPFLSVALQDSFELVQINALTVMGTIQTKQSRQWLIGALDTKNYTVLLTALSQLAEDKNILADKRLSDTITRKSIQTFDRLSPFDDEEAMIEIMNSITKLGSQQTEPFLRKFINHPNVRIAKHASAKIKEVTGKDVPWRQDQSSIQRKVDYEFLSKLKSQSPIAVIHTNKGDIEIDFYFDEAPLSVMNFVKLAEKKYYDGQNFHRVVSNFVIQAGDPTGTGWGGPGYSIRSEFSAKKYERGSVGMASAGKDTEGSQWFICHSPQPHLEGRYTVFGKVRNGMDVVDQIQVGDQIISVRINRF